MQSWLEGRNWLGKCAQATGMTANLRILSIKADSNTWEKLHKEWNWAGVSASRVTTLRPSSGKGLPSPLWKPKHCQKHLPGLRRKRTGLLLSGLKSSFQMKVILLFIWKSRSQSLEEERRGTESMLLEVQCEVSTVSDDLSCHVIRSHLPGNFRALHAFFCWQALWRCWFHFPAGLGTCSHCQMYQKLV